MTAESITNLLHSRIVGRPVRVYQEVGSTNDLAMELGADDAPEGCAIFAESQTCGRGRLGRRWQGHRGDSLAFSVLLRPRWPEVARISLVAAVAVARVLQKITPEEVGIKWPNDIYIAGKKIAGILCEAGKHFVVVGIGINVSQGEDDFSDDLRGRAGSMRMFSEQPVDRAVLAAALLDELDCIYATLPESFEEIISECEQRSVLLEKTIEVEHDGVLLSGVVAGLDSFGRLKIRNPAGEDIVLSAGEVTVRKY